MIVSGGDGSNDGLLMIVMLFEYNIFKLSIVIL